MPLPAETVLAWIKRIADGESVSRMIRESGIQSWDFWGALDQNPELASAYAMATRARSELLADEVIEIVDSDDNVIRARNRSDARRWLAGKLQPTKYGERLDVNVTQTIDIGQAMVEARARVLPVSDQRNVIDAEYTEESIASLLNTIENKSTSSDEAAESAAAPLPDLFD